MSIKYPLSISIVLLSLTIVAQVKPAKPSLQNLFYCNSYFNISKLWIVNDGQVIGARQFKGENHIRDLVLIGRNGLIKDSLSLLNEFDTNDYFFYQVEDVQAESDNSIYVQSGRTLIPVKLDSQKLIFSDTALIRLRKELLNKLYSTNREILATYFLQFNDLIIGYDRDKLKVKKNNIKKKNDAENFPNFWVIKAGDIGLSKIYINKETKPETNALYWDVHDWDNTWDRTTVFSRYVSVHKGKIYFNVGRANKCYVYDIANGEISSINFPAIEHGEVCNYFYDNVENKEYVIKRDKVNNYHVYLYNSDHSIIYPIMSTDSQPLNIVNGNVHVTKEQKENNQSFKCHYLLPITNFQNETKSVLKEIIIKDN